MPSTKDSALHRQLTIQVLAQTSAEPFILSAELAPDSTIADLKTFLVASADLPSNTPQHTWILNHNGNIVSSSDETSLKDVGIVDGDLVTATPRPIQAAPQTQTLSQTQSAEPVNLSPEVAARMEELRQHILSHQGTRTQFEQQAGAEFTRDGSDLNTILNDPSLFARKWQDLEQRRRQEMNRLAAEEARLDSDVNEENQKEIMRRIQQEQIRADLEKVLEDNPEMLGSVTMLYISVEVNGRPVKAFVDSGAQTTILSPACAEACGIMHLIDDRFAGIARGVGTARILGRIHKAMLKIGSPDTGYDDVPCSFTVMEGKGVDMLLGLDMLKRYQADISLRQNSLVFPNGVKIPFLPEHEIPKDKWDDAGPESSSTATTGAKGTSPIGGSGSTAAPSNFQGSGHTLGSGPTSTPATASSTSQQPSQRQTQQRPTQTSNPQFPQQHIDTLVGMGASPQQAVELLRQSRGNVEIAASLLFDM